jgi:amino acid permease
MLLLPMNHYYINDDFLNWMLWIWLPLTLSGYIQWFVIMPRLIRYRNSNHKKKLVTMEYRSTRYLAIAACTICIGLAWYIGASWLEGATGASVASRCII